MSRNVILIAVASVLAFTGVGVWLATLPTYEDKLNDCVAAVKSEWSSDSELANNRPAACEDVKEDDYTAILVGVAAEKSGLSDLLGD